jgi:hypothetical protein
MSGLKYLYHRRQSVPGGVTILCHHDARRQISSQNVAGGLRHGERGFARTDQQDTARLFQRPILLLHMQLPILDTQETPHSLAGINRL